MKTLVLGASPKPYRYSNKVVLVLQEAGFEVIPIGINPGNIGSQRIYDLYQKPLFSDIHTITIYLNKWNQEQWYSYLIDLMPSRVIFNPGSENPEFYRLLGSSGIEFEEACTLVMLNTGSYI